MPKPLSEIYPTAFMQFDPDAILENEELAARVAAVLNESNNLELELGYSLTRLLKTQPLVGVGIYQAVYTGSLKRNVLLLAGEQALSPIEQAIFATLVDLVKGIGERRNKIAHAIWGWSAQVPDALLAIQPLDLLKYGVHWREFDPDTDPYEVIQEPLSAKDVQVYVQQDFTELMSDILAIGVLFETFWAWKHQGSVVNDKSYRKLSSRPEIHAKLSRLQKGRKKKT
jgi:hypothetical protein